MQLRKYIPSIFLIFLAPAFGFSVMAAAPKASVCSPLFRAIFRLKNIPFAKEHFKIGNGKLGALPSESLNILVWNAHKGLHKNWDRDFARLNDGSDLLLIQEAKKDRKLDKIFSQDVEKEWWFGAGFVKRDALNGVVTGSRAQAINTKVFRSPSVEPLIGTPKIAIATSFKIGKNGDEVLVVNVHALNFVAAEKFSNQMRELVSFVKFHRGPVIFAGDFNIWNPKREQVVDSLMKELNLSKVEVNRRKGIMELDRVYVRGFDVHSADAVREVRSSDHLPIRLRMSLNNTN